jgi:DNA mismatch endonuclease (patch repair protein)
MDHLTAHQRHVCMSHNRSKDTEPEWVVRRLVHALGFRYRLHVASLPGKPDLVLPRHRKAIFVHGCFWHAHGCRQSQQLPATRTHYWRDKFAKNVARDQKALRQLWQAGWQVLVVWECETRNAEQLRATLGAFLADAPRPANYDLTDQHALYGRVAEADC